MTLNSQGSVREAPKVLITPEAKQRLDLYVQYAKGEISGLGRAKYDGFDLLVEEIFLLPQDSGSSNTDLDPEGLSSFLTDWVNEGRNPAQLKLWWHSHANMGTSWSSTDETTISGFNADWILSIVVNKQGDYLCRLDIYEPVRVTIDKLQLVVYCPEPTDLRNEIQQEIKDKVRTPKPPPTPKGSGWKGKKGGRGSGKGSGNGLLGDVVFVDATQNVQWPADPKEGLVDM